MVSSGNSKRFLADFEPIGRRVEVEEGTSLLVAAQSAGVEIVALCGGLGACQSCKVRLVRGELSPPTRAEENALDEDQILANYRLACQARIASDVTIDIPPESLTTPQRLQIEGQEIEIALDPVVTPIDIEISPPSLDDLRADSIRLKDALQELGIASPVIELLVLGELSNQLREQRWCARLAMRGGEVVAVLPPGGQLLGLAIDIGTTKVAAYLVDLDSGKTVAKIGAMNPQIGYGEDVVSRIVHADKGHKHRAELQEEIIETLNDMIADLCAEGRVEPERIVETVVVGNTAMHHLFLGLPTHQLAAAPYVPALNESIDVRAKDLGLNVAPSAYVHLPPNIAGYVGADHVAMLLATGLWQTEKTVLALDIGTNTEITLASGGRLLSCSCASGPAFEGAHIQDGMRAAPGAIERVQIVPSEVRIQTVGGQPPIGICGSGILDAVAGMLSAQALDASGKIQEDHPLVRAKSNGKVEFILVGAEETGHGRDIVVTQKDVHEFQLAKAAIQVGIEILLAEAGLEPGTLEAFIVAGAFGTYVDVGSAIGVGMFPPLPLERFRQVGNAAGVGAKRMLVSAQQRQMAEDIAQQVDYIELAKHPRFSDEFLEAMYLSGEA